MHPSTGLRRLGLKNVLSDTSIQYGVECLSDRNKPHSAAWLRLYDIDDSSRSLDIVYPVRPYPVPLITQHHVGSIMMTLRSTSSNAHPQDVHALGGRPVTQLHVALDKGHPNVAMLLLENGTDIMSRDVQNLAPLHKYHPLLWRRWYRTMSRVSAPQWHRHNLMRRRLYWALARHDVVSCACLGYHVRRLSDSGTNSSTTLGEAEATVTAQLFPRTLALYEFV